MTVAALLKVGDRLQSPVGLFGRVSRIKNGTVYVTYSAKGGTSEAIYTPDWFRRYGELLQRVPKP